MDPPPVSGEGRGGEEMGEGRGGEGRGGEERGGEGRRGGGRDERRDSVVHMPVLTVNNPLSPSPPLPPPSEYSRRHSVASSGGYRGQSDYGRSYGRRRSDDYGYPAGYDRYVGGRRGGAGGGVGGGGGRRGGGVWLCVCAHACRALSCAGGCGLWKPWLLGWVVMCVLSLVMFWC